MVAIFVGKLLASILKMLFNVFSKASYFNHFFLKSSFFPFPLLLVCPKTAICTRIYYYSLSPPSNLPHTWNPLFGWYTVEGLLPFFPAKEGHTHHHSTGNDLDTCQWHSRKNSDFGKGRFVFESRFCHIPILWVCFLLCKKNSYLSGHRCSVNGSWY